MSDLTRHASDPDSRPHPAELHAIPKFTQRQRDALTWLTPDWQSRPRMISTAVDSLRTYHSRLVETKWGERAQSRLTAEGAAVKKALNNA